MKDKVVLFYSHGGSANHGCEAIVRGSIKILKNFNKFKVFSKNPDEDIKYGINEIATILQAVDPIKKNTLRYLLYLIKMKLLKLDTIYYNEIYRNIATKSSKGSIAFSIGGDNYCYDGFSDELKVLNKKFNSKGIKTVLWGCSIEPVVLTKEIIKDLSVYTLIIARETISYNALLDKGLKNVKLFPDPAFQLERIDAPLPTGFIEKNTVGINVSPLIIREEREPGITLLNYIRLIEYIIEHTTMQIALIPHVVWAHNDDREPLKQLANHFKGSERIIQISDSNAMVLKGYIARCLFFVAARTHASIAAYSQSVPTLVVGYSVKARGIATDIFGTDEGYVVPVQSLKEGTDLTKAFKVIKNREVAIKEHYANMMEGYKTRALEAGEVYEI